MATQETSAGTFQEGGVVLNPWTADGKFTDDVYNRLIEQFGVHTITKELLERFERVTGQRPHRMLRRGLFFAHRQLEEILDDVEAGKPIFIYTGRGPSTDSLHLGHILPIEFTVWLQKVFKAIVVFQMADDEKYWFKDISFETVYELGKKNARDIIALGFDPLKTFVFSNRDYSRTIPYQKVAFDIMKNVHISTIQAIFGIKGNGCAGQLVWPIYQSTAAFAEAFGPLFKRNDGQQTRCLVAYAIDQDPYFRLCRDVAPKLGFLKPCSIMCRFLPALEGDAKMSSTNNTNKPSQTIFMTDTPKEIGDKIRKFAFSGGQETVELHRQLGGDIDTDISFQWLRHFLEDDTELLRIAEEYRSGRMLTGELKNIVIKVITDMVVLHQEEKSKVTDEMVEQFYTMDNIEF